MANFLSARTSSFVLGLPLLAACASPMTHYSGKQPAMVYVPIAHAGITDARPAFRQLFCARLRETANAPTADCDQFLVRREDEAPALPPKALPYQQAAVDILTVGGVFSECLPNITAFGDATEALRTLGYAVDEIPVKGRASTEHNARIIRDHIMSLRREGRTRKFLILAYSKGAADTMTALVAHPELAEQVAGVVSFAAAVNGSPLADRYLEAYRQLLSKLPNAHCERTDRGEMDSLTRAGRLVWLSTHTLPQPTLYFSLVATPAPERVSSLLLPMHAALSKVDPDNDGLLLHADAILPGAALLGYANADHFAIALPFHARAPLLAASLMDKNQFPRPELIESAVRFAQARLAENALLLKAK